MQIAFELQQSNLNTMDFKIWSDGCYEGIKTREHFNPLHLNSLWITVITWIDVQFSQGQRDHQEKP